MQITEVKLVDHDTMEDVTLEPGETAQVRQTYVSRSFSQPFGTATLTYLITKVDQ